MILKIYIKLKEYLYHQAYYKSLKHYTPEINEYLKGQAKQIAALKAITKTK